MAADRAHFLRTGLLWAPVLAVVAFGAWYALDWSHQNGEGAQGFGGAELDVKSEFSRIRVTKFGNVRTLWFVRDNGDEVIESQVDLKKPHDLLVEYTRFMFLSYLVRPKQDRVLIVGLGGGSMVHFLQHYEPNTKVDVVEIDPVIVKIADKYFGVKSGGNVNIITKDAFAYIKETDAKYDVIYMDAFLKPALGKTDETGNPLKLKTINFYKDLQKHLNADGLVVYNINPHDGLENDIKTIAEAFPSLYVFELRYGGVVVVASMAAKQIDPATLLAEGADLDKRFKTSYSYRTMVKTRLLK